MDGNTIREKGRKKIKTQQEVLERIDRQLSFDMTWTAQKTRKLGGRHTTRWPLFITSNDGGEGNKNTQATR